MAKARRRKVPTPSTAWADRLEDAADYTARYDVPITEALEDAPIKRTTVWQVPGPV